MAEIILTGDALEQLRKLPPESVHTCVTSPPYYNLRDYGAAGQIGNEASVEEYLQTLVSVFHEVRRVLRADGTLWVNMGDSYYCHPYCSSERGSNEKQNQMIRRKFTKGTNFDKVTQKDVEAVESWLNRYPRQLLGWASAGQLFEGYLQTV